jgi:hypothetical protein
VWGFGFGLWVLCSGGGQWVVGCDLVICSGFLLGLRCVLVNIYWVNIEVDYVD